MTIRLRGEMLRDSWALTLSLSAGAGLVAGFFFLEIRRRRREKHPLGNLGTAHPSAALYSAVYLDYNATTPIWPEVKSVMEPYTLHCFGNPSSPHVFAAPCREAVAKARHLVAELINATSDDTIVFTGCGTESDNMAIRLALQQQHSPSKTMLPHVVTCAVEHPAVLLYLKDLEKSGEAEVTVLPVDAQGFVSPVDVQRALQPNTCLVTIMHSNNEVGTVQPIKEIARVVRAFNSSNASSSSSSSSFRRVLLHTDAAQSLGKLAVDVEVLGVDMLTIVGHKFGAPKGVAALYVRDSPLAGARSSSPLLIGGGQERGRRSGTENVLLIAALGEASRIAKEEGSQTLLRMLTLKQRIIKQLLAALAKVGVDQAAVRFNGPRRSVDVAEIATDLALLRVMLAGFGGAAAGDAHPPVRLDLDQLPNTLSVSFRSVLAHALMPLLADKVACSAGSACHSEQTTVSPVLRAMHVPEDFALGTLRLSWGRHTTEAEIDIAAKHIAQAVASLRAR